MYTNKKTLVSTYGAEGFGLWAHTDSNRGPSACKADALNQLSYAPQKGGQIYKGRNEVQMVFGS